MTRFIDVHVHPPLEEFYRGAFAPFLAPLSDYLGREIPTLTVDEFAEEYRSRDGMAVLWAWDAEVTTGQSAFSNSRIAEIAAARGPKLVALDFSNRGLFCGDMTFSTSHVGGFDTELVSEFLRALAHNAGLTLHVRLICGENTHHQIEAVFKALGRALRQALAVDARRADTVPSTKGVL